jgi:hypothetical protein
MLPFSTPSGSANDGTFEERLEALLGPWTMSVSPLLSWFFVRLLSLPIGDFSSMRRTGIE